MKMTCLYPVLVLCAVAALRAGQNQKRNRGELFYHCFSANTPGPGNVWLDVTALGHIWDDSPLTTDTAAVVADASADTRRWVSNIRAFPEVRLMAGVTDFLSLHVESRLLSYGFEPGFYRGGIRLTMPDNKDLRLNNYGLAVNYTYIVRERAPSLGGYLGFMPEGFGIMGGTIETRVLYELDLIKRTSRLPVRMCVNAGLRYPLEKRKELYQFLFDLMVVYSGHNYDLFAGYSLESFMNFFAPISIDQGPKRFLVWFSENPMYASMGGNIRYENGVTLSLTVPLLLSVNHGSRMRRDDMVELIHRQSNGRFMYEKDRNIRDPFDPWYVKWKVVGTITVPIRFKMTGAEMMRNYLLLKNRNVQKVIDIDSKVSGEETNTRENDDKERIEKIRKKREELSR